VTVFIVIYHDVWDSSEDPGVENEYGQPEDTQIEGVYSTRNAAEAAIRDHLKAFPTDDATHNFHTIEEHLLTP
jgi:hypothetical protein